MERHMIEIPLNRGGPIQYLGCRNLTYPDFTGHMRSCNSWINKNFSLIVANTKGKKFGSWYEPFAGTASWTFNAMAVGLAEKYVINDCNIPLITTLKLLQKNPKAVKETYANLVKQFSTSSLPKDFFIETIEAYNKAQGDAKALLLPFIFNHVWGGIVFYNDDEDIIYREPTFDGKTYPGYIEKANLSVETFFDEVDRISKLLNNNQVIFQTKDFLESIKDAKAGDFVAMNPPYPSNERSSSEKLSIYQELYGPRLLHDKLLGSVEQMEKQGIDYCLLYGRYEPNLNDFVLRDKANQPKNFFELVGYPQSIFGESLLQTYFSPNYTVPNGMHATFITAKEVLEDKMPTKQEALNRFRKLSHQREQTTHTLPKPKVKGQRAPEPLALLYSNYQPVVSRRLPPLPPEKRIGYAIIGLGTIALDYIIPSLAECNFSKLTAIVTGDPQEKGKNVASDYGIPATSVYAYDEWEKLKNNPDIQAVFITSPNAMHKEHVLEAAKIGKHVICEKPMATTIEDAKLMDEACKKAGVKLMIGYRCHFEPHHQALREMIEKGRLGKLQLIEAHHGQVQYQNAQWRHSQKIAGGGSLYGIGIYCLNFARYVTDEEPIEVNAWAWSPNGDSRFTEIESNVSWQMRFPSGVVAKLSSSYDTYASATARLYFEKGIVDMDPAFFYSGINLKVKYRSPDNPEVCLLEQPLIGQKNQFAQEIDYFSECILNNTNPTIAGVEGVKDMIILDAIYQSARENRPVKLNTPLVK